MVVRAVVSIRPMLETRERPQERQIAEIEQGLEEAKRGEFASDEEMRRWFEEIEAAGKPAGS